MVGLVETPKKERFLAKVKAKATAAPAMDVAGLLCKPSGELRKIIANAITILEDHPQWRGALRMDQFANRIDVRGTPPIPRPPGAELMDTDATETAAWLSRHYPGLDLGSNVVMEAMAAVAARNAFHPVREYLGALKWDQTPRLDLWLQDAFEADDTAYTRSVAKNALIGAVARVMRPGSQMDNMLILEGAQGIGKTKAVRILASAPWYSETAESPGSKDFLQGLRGKWIVEIGELDSFRKADLTRIKQVITATQDTYRPSYGRLARDFPRQNIFVGTTNESHYLEDPTGARRFWPVRCRAANPDYLREQRDQLWAEALVRFQAGESWWDVPWQDAVEQQEDRYVQDSWEELVLPWLLVNPGPQTTSAILARCLEMDFSHHDRRAQMRVGTIMRRLGYRVERMVVEGVRGRFYVK